LSIQKGYGDVVYYFTIAPTGKNTFREGDRGKQGEAAGPGLQ
jgi:hypothetical protein